MRRLFVSLLCILALLPAISSAQLDSGFSNLNQSLTVTLEPTYPAPGETVTASIDDYALGASFGSITWLVNGKEELSVRNNRSFSFQAGNLGEKTTVTVRLTLPGGSALEASGTVTPIYTDIIVEPQTYTPQTYAGRALPTVGSLIRATALVTGSTGSLSPEGHSYLWKLNGTTIGGGGRTGAFQTSYIIPYGNNHTLSVEVFDRQGNMVTRRGVNVKTSDVDLKFYEVSSLYGLHNTTVGNSLQFIGNSLTIRAIPYNLDLRSTAQNTFSEWRLGGQKTTNENGDPYEMTFERTGQGRSDLMFKLRHREALLQGGEVSTSLNF